MGKKNYLEILESREDAVVSWKTLNKEFDFATVRSETISEWDADLTTDALDQPPHFCIKMG